MSFRVHTAKYYFITQREKLHIQADTTQNIIFYSWLNFQHMGLGLTLSHLWNTLGAWPGFIKPNHPSVYPEWQSKKYKKGNLRDRQQSVSCVSATPAGPTYKEGPLHLLPYSVHIRAPLCSQRAHPLQGCMNHHFLSAH